MKTLWQFFTEFFYKKEKSIPDSVNPQITDAVTQHVIQLTEVKKETTITHNVKNEDDVQLNIVQEPPKLKLVEKTEVVSVTADEKSDVIEVKVEHIKDKKTKKKIKPIVNEQKKAEVKTSAKRGPKKSKNT